jgi:hypothetical protein
MTKESLLIALYAYVIFIYFDFIFFFVSARLHHMIFLLRRGLICFDLSCNFGGRTFTANNFAGVLIALYVIFIFFFFFFFLIFFSVVAWYLPLYRLH